MIAGNYNKHECKCGHELRVCLATSCEYSELAPVAASLHLDDEKSKLIERDSALRAEPAAGATRLSLVMLSLRDARAIAMRNTAAARIPECGDFGRIAQDLDWAINEMEQDEAVMAEQSEATRCRAEGGATSNNVSEKPEDRTPPAEVSADTLPNLSPERILAIAAEQDYAEEDPKCITRLARAIESEVRAPYAEQIKKLERELSGHKAARIAYASEFAPNADGEPDVGNIHANIRNLKRELAERKQSIDTPEFRALAEKWQLCLTTDIESVYAELVAYIDARPAGTAPAVLDDLTEAERAFVELVKANPGRKLGHREAFDSDDKPLWQKPEALGLIECLGSYKWCAAAPSLSTGTEESK